jgi:probable HAF family extracellular repeat protein
MQARRGAWLAARSMAFALTLASAVRAQPPHYTVVQLTVGNTSSSVAYDINASGQVVGQAVVDGTPTRAVLWTTDALTDLGSLNGTYNAAYGISNNATVVGWSSYSDFHAFIWQDGAIRDAGGSTSVRTMAYAVNDSGTVVGDILSGPGSRTTAAIWQNGTRTALPTYVPCNGCLRNDNARDINSSGQIVGQTETPFRRAALWQNGTVTQLGTLGGDSSAAFGINESGHVVGQAQLPSAAPTYGATRAFVWKNGTMTSLGTLGDSTGFSAAYGINAAGAVVGRYTKQPGASITDPGRGFLWVNGVMYDLTTLVAGSGWTIADARAINDAGQIAATGRQGTGVERALLLNPSGFVTPPPAHTLYLAEGATSAFFDTQLALLNPGPITTSATLTYTLGDGQAIVREVPVPARSRRTILAKQVPGLAAAEFATRVDSYERLVLDRTMTWDSTGYGSHSETAVQAPATTWYLAEGATIGGFSLFYLLQNPAATPTTVQVRYLRPSGSPLVKTYVLPARSRTNIWVNEEDFPGMGKALASAEFSAVIESQDGTPIIVERAMYRSNQGRTFNAGHASMGVTAPATDWFLAEGATGPFFDMFVLIANPTPTNAQVKVTYLTIDGTTYNRTLEAPANSRSGIWVDEETFTGVAGKPLADAAVSTTVESVNDVPLVVERAMWWPGDSNSWHEAHNSAGATATGTKWAVASGEVGGTRAYETYLLIANTSAFAGSATVTVMFENGTSAVRTYALPPSSRTNVAVGPEFGAAVANQRFGAVIESTGDTPAQIVVERAMYSSANGVGFAAGTNALATKLK